MLDIVTDDVDGWYKKPKANEEIKFLKELAGKSSAPIRAFLIEDPGWYTVKLFELATQ